LFVQEGVKVTTVAIGTHGRTGKHAAAVAGGHHGGQYYVVKDPKVLPKIYQRKPVGWRVRW